MADAVRNILARRRDRMIATILGAKEDLCDSYVPGDMSSEFRKIILDQINDYYDLCTDLLRSVQPDSVVVNEKWLEKLDEIHEAMVNANRL